jgi:pimeloyl-ACP methyl ester carboxylesterase
MATALAVGALLAGGVTAQAQEARVPDRFADQQIAWKACVNLPPGLPPGAERLECGTYRAPRDWHNPGDGNVITIAVSRLRPVNGKAKGSVLTNPGGPGGPGRTFPLAFVGRAKLVDNMDVIGIDVRGTGESTNLTCGNYDWLLLTDPRDRSKANLDQHFGTAEQQARACQVSSGEFNQYVNTEQTVRDLDLLRHLLGREKINWIGYSGGTWMGAYYATYFPNRVDKFVLDSNTEFTSTFQTVFDSYVMGFERRFRVDFLPWVAKYDSLYHLGTTGEQVRQNYEQLRAKLVAQPLPLPDGSQFTAPLLDFSLSGAQYSKQSFPDAATNFAALRRAVDQPGVASADAVKSAAALGRYADAGNGTFHAIVCNDTQFKGDRRFLERRSAELGKQFPLIGWYQVIAPCATWERPPLRLKTPTGQGVPPVLMVQSVRDPATPLEGAQRAHQKFAGSRLLTVTDEGDHGIYAFGNPCVDKVVESFVVDGVVPPRDSTCAGVPLPVPTATLSTTAQQHPIGWPL